jgi:DNA-directed RNA polymerase specialized sigma24 family protein
MNEDDLTLVTRKANSIANTWPDCDPRDLVQELCLQWLEHSDSIQPYLDDPDEKRGMAFLDTTLRRWAHAWCRKETAAVRGNDDYQRYSASQVKLMLPSLFSPEAWGALAVSGAGGKSNRPAREGGDSLATYADLTRAWELLSFEQQQLLFARWVCEDPGCFEPLADAWDVSVDVLRSRCSRALAYLVKLLAGKPLERPGRRYTMSNAAAQSITAKMY